MKVIDKHEVLRLVEDERAQIVEVLPSESYELEHIQGAVSLPLEELTPDAVRSLDRNRPVVTYCNDFL